MIKCIRDCKGKGRFRTQPAGPVPAQVGMNFIPAPWECHKGNTFSEYDVVDGKYCITYYHCIWTFDKSDFIDLSEVRNEIIENILNDF